MFHGLEHAIDECFKLDGALLLRIHLIKESCELLLRRILAKGTKQLTKLARRDRALSRG